MSATNVRAWLIPLAVSAFIFHYTYRTLAVETAPAACIERIARALAPAPRPAGPADEALAAFLAARDPNTRRAQLAAFADDTLEPAGTDPVLRRSGYDLDRFHSQIDAVIEEAKGHWAGGRPAEALPLLRAGLRVCRIVSRGRAGGQYVRFWHAGTWAGVRLHRALGDAAPRGQAGDLKAIAAIYAEVLEREVGPEQALKAEFTERRRVLRWYNASLLWWSWSLDDGGAYLDQALADCRAGKTIADSSRIDHPVIRSIGIKVHKLVEYHRDNRAGCERIHRQASA